ncbi:MAG: PIN domain-containing protein [Roseibacillus sp.]
MRLFLDTNILLDVAQGRESFYEASSKIVQFAHRDENEAFLSWHSMATLFYILSKPWGESKTREYLTDILSWAELAPTSQGYALKALAMDGKDFEDDLQSQCAVAANCDYIITRNTKDFASSSIGALTPSDFWERFGSEE